MIKQSSDLSKIIRPVAYVVVGGLIAISASVFAGYNVTTPSHVVEGSPSHSHSQVSPAQVIGSTSSSAQTQPASSLPTSSKTTSNAANKPQVLGATTYQSPAAPQAQQQEPSYLPNCHLENTYNNGPYCPITPPSSWSTEFPCHIQDQGAFCDPYTSTLRIFGERATYPVCEFAFTDQGSNGLVKRVVVFDAHTDGPVDCLHDYARGYPVF